MSLFRKKPVVIEAVQNDGLWGPIVEWLNSLSTGLIFQPGEDPPITRNQDGSLNITTREGVMRGEVGDWIISGIKGELYPCKPDIFAATYEPVGD
jgi:hypothetical protein